MLDPAESQRCAEFLEPFAKVFTVNYDLLLHWVIADNDRLNLGDGFVEGLWGGPNAAGQKVFYLHGALHLLRAGPNVKRMTEDQIDKLFDNLESRLESRDYPLLVLEGTWNQKLLTIGESRYLEDAYEHLQRNNRPLLIYGFRFGLGDRHIINAIANSKAPALTVVLHSGGTPKARAEVRGRATALATRMGVEPEFRESDDYNIWR